MTPAAMAIAERHAAADRDLLARLVREGAVRRQRDQFASRGSAKAFVRDIEARVSPPVNLALRPKNKRGKR